MIGKLRGRSPAELRDRLVQLGWKWTERAGLMPSPVVATTIATMPITPWGDVDTDGIRQRLGADERAALIARADRIVRDRFDVLGIEGLSYGDPVDWQRDPIAGRSAPRVHWSAVPYLDADVVGDHKVTWEVNRHHWFVALAQAWQLTGDRRYPTHAASLLREWLAENPPKIGINWCSSLELAFRVHAWIHGVRLMGESAGLPADLTRAMLESVVVQTLHIERNLSTWFSPNTHLTGEALALLSVGCAWPELPDAARWRKTGWDILCRQLPVQVLRDGVYFEQSAWYQAYTVDFYVMAIAWARLARFDLPDDMLARLRTAALALRAVTRPDGTIVRLGDDDGGHALRLCARPFGDTTDTLWRAAALLDDDTLVPPVDGGRSALLWLEGAATFERLATRLPAPLPRAVALRDGGWVVLSESGRSAAEDHWLFVDAAPHGTAPYAHSHADALAFDLSVNGVPVFVDAGTGAYVGEPRTRFRSTGTHNTVTVDGRDSSEQWSSFKWKSAATSRLVGCGAAAGAQWMTATHDGYERLADPVRHHRTILRFDRRYWLMFDTLTATDAHQVTLTFQCATDAHPHPRSAHTFDVSARGTAVSLALDPALEARIEARAVSPAYGLEMAASAIIATATTHGSTTFATVIGAGAESGPLALTRTEAPSVWRVTHRSGDDLVACPAGRTLTIGPATFDGTALALLGGDAPQTIVAAGHGTLHLATHRISLGADEICVLRCEADGTWTREP
ncbi:MAG: alginate lyase family protein [Gemmatimonadaceae bacterium]|nr:alginate lyase family protein [Gemmatimonadaceae bacterium]